MNRLMIPSIEDHTVRWPSSGPKTRSNMNFWDDFEEGLKDWDALRDAGLFESTATVVGLTGLMTVRWKREGTLRS